MRASPHGANAAYHDERVSDSDHGGISVRKSPVASNACLRNSTSLTRSRTTIRGVTLCQPPGIDLGHWPSSLVLRWRRPEKKVRRMPPAPTAPTLFRQRLQSERRGETLATASCDEMTW
jgi:hypothetical protein